MNADIQPELCIAAGCDRMGEALIEQYEIDPDARTTVVGIMRPSGKWIWLCGPHVVEEFS